MNPYPQPYRPPAQQLPAYAPMPQPPMPASWRPPQPHVPGPAAYPPPPWAYQPYPPYPPQVYPPQPVVIRPQKRTGWIIHPIMFFATGGLWLPIWIWYLIRNNRARVRYY